MPSILNTGISALNAFQRQLTTTGHNIANVNTEGYSRQTVQFDARTTTYAGGDAQGAGVDVASITRNYDQYLSDRVRSYSASQQEFTVYYERASQVDNVIADAAAGLDTMLQDFYKSIQDVSADPTSIPARNVMLNNSEMLVDRFDSLTGWMEDLRNQVNRDYEDYVAQINGLGESIAAVNTRIRQVQGDSAFPPNDLLDQRDHLVDQLSQFVNVRTVEQGDGSYNVMIGNGQPLVVDTMANRLVVTNSAEAPDHKELGLTMVGGSTVNVTDSVSGGKLGGLLRFRDEVLDPAQNSLGLVAIGLGSAFNEEHLTGMDLDGDLGGNYFAVAVPEVLSDPTNTGTIAVAFDNIADLNNHEYQLDYDGANWSIRDLTTDSTTVLGAAGPFTFNGLDISVTSAPAAGDSYRLRPTRRGGSSIDTILKDPRDIAAAEAVRGGDAASNTGTGHISPGSLVTRTGTSLAGLPVTLTFNAALNQFDLSTGGSVAYNPATDSGTPLTVSIAGLGDFSFEMTGAPDNGDAFTLSNNTGGVGDNRNALKLAGLQDAKLMLGGTATMADTYGYMVSDVGTQTYNAGANADVQYQLLQQAESAKSAVSGVNLDEEAANLVRFQQAYSAAAQVIATANTLFDSLLGAVRR